jgi:hypothetical protein
VRVGSEWRRQDSVQLDTKQKARAHARVSRSAIGTAGFDPKESAAAKRPQLDPGPPDATAGAPATASTSTGACAKRWPSCTTPLGSGEIAKTTSCRFFRDFRPSAPDLPIAETAFCRPKQQRNSNGESGCYVSGPAPGWRTSRVAPGTAGRCGSGPSAGRGGGCGRSSMRGRKAAARSR